MRRVAAFWSVLCLNLLAGAKAVAAPVEGAPRVALVIGNSTYTGLWPELRTEPRRDAELMRETLTTLGFEVVYRRDADLAQMKGALRDFRKALLKSPGAVAVVYFAGHGTQAFVTGATGAVHIENFLIPAHTDLAVEADVRDKAIALARVESVIRSAGASAGVVLLDASRDNALPHARKGVSVALHGMAAQRSPDELVVYATHPGRLAYRTHGDVPSVFTQALAAELAAPGSIKAAILRVRSRVAEATQSRAFGAQEPDVEDRLTQDLVLVPSLTPPPPAVADRVSDRVTVPISAFRDCAGCPEMVRVPPGSFVMGSPDEEERRAANEGPTHEVRISYTLAVSKYPITRGQWRQYLAESGKLGSRNCYGFNYAQGKWAKTEGYGWDDPGFRQEDSHPVVCVSWDEAQDYAVWLSGKTGHHYRLLSEAEFEYVERARSRTAYPWGATSEGQCTHVNAADATAQARFATWTDAAGCSDGFLFTAPVDHFPATALGLHDIDGNSRSWTSDCYHESYQGAPVDGSAWESGGDCSFRMIRGASWSTRPAGLRSAARHSELAVANADDTGLRVATTDFPPPSARTD